MTEQAIITCISALVGGLVAMAGMAVGFWIVSKR